MEEEIKSILQKLDALQKKHERKTAEAEGRFERALNLARMITDTINSVAPQQIQAMWMGSLTNPHVSDYPKLLISAVTVYGNRLICSWIINPETGEIPVLTAEDIVKDIDLGLKKIS